MIRSKNSFTPLCSLSEAGSTLNDGIVQGEFCVSVPSDKLAITSLDSTNPLNVCETPFTSPPDVVVESPKT